MSYFLDPNNVHDLGKCFYLGLLDVLTKHYVDADFGQVVSVETEVATESGKRIDLLIEADKTLIIVECKIYHHQNNPFEEYTKYAKKRIKRQKQTEQEKLLLQLVLSLDGQIATEIKDKNWHGISYNQLVSAIEPHLSSNLLANSYNKWVFFAREFLLHLKELNQMSEVNQKEIDFLTENFHEFARLSELIYETIVPQIATKIENDLINSQLESFSCKVSKVKWYGYEPVIKFSNKNWNSQSDIVVWITKDNQPTSCKVNLHICSKAELLLSKVEKFKTQLEKHPDILHNCKEKKERDWWEFSWQFKPFDLELVSKKVVELMYPLNNLELSEIK